MTKSDTIRRMFAYIRTWWLLHKLARYCLLAECHWNGPRLKAYTRLIRKMGVTSQDHPELGVFPLEGFLEQRAKKYWFYLGCLTQKRTRKRIERDRALLEKCSRGNTPQWVKIMTGKDCGFTSERQHHQYLQITPLGNFFASSYTNGLNGFLREYKEYEIRYIVITCVVFGIGSYAFVSIKTFLQAGLCTHGIVILCG